VHDGVAGGQCRGDLGAGQRQREIERCDGCHHAERFTTRQNPDLRLVRRTIGAVHRMHGESAEKAEQPGAVRHDDVDEVAIRHAHIHCFAQREVFRPIVQQIGHAKQDPCASFVMQVRPVACLECAARRCNRCVGVLRGRLRKLRDGLLGGRIDRRKGRAVGRVTPFAVDQQLSPRQTAALWNPRRFLIHGRAPYGSYGETIVGVLSVLVYAIGQ